MLHVPLLSSYIATHFSLFLDKFRYQNYMYKCDSTVQIPKYIITTYLGAKM